MKVVPTVMLFYYWRTEYALYWQIIRNAGVKDKNAFGICEKTLRRRLWQRILQYLKVWILNFEFMLQIRFLILKRLIVWSIWRGDNRNKTKSSTTFLTTPSLKSFTFVKIQKRNCFTMYMLLQRCMEHDNYVYEYRYPINPFWKPQRCSERNIRLFGVKIIKKVHETYKARLNFVRL